MVFPAWLAMTPQSPVLRNVTTDPEMLQLPFGTIVNVTGRPEVAVALTVSVVPTVCAAIVLKVMVWAFKAALTVKVCEIDGAAE